MKTVSYPTKDYDFQTYFKLEGFGNNSFYLFPDEADLRADTCDYSEVDGRDYETITQGEWVLIDGKEYVTVICGKPDDEVPARFIAADTMPVMIMDGAGFLTINGVTLRDHHGRINDEVLDGEGGEWRLGFALRTAQLEGHIPAHCEFVLDNGGSYHKIHRD